MTRGRDQNVRGEAFRELFGEQCVVNTELGPISPLVDICEYAPAVNAAGETREFFTLVTWGVSDRRMPNPSAETPYRCELVLYCDRPKAEYRELLRWLAKMPFTEKDVWFDFGTTVTNGTPPEPLFDESPLSSILFLWSPIVSDQALMDSLRIGGDPVILLWIVPITESERRFIQSEGTDAFLSVMDEHEHPLLLDEKRPGYL